MSGRGLASPGRLLAAGLAALVLAGAPAAGLAQIRTDGSLGPGTRLHGPDFVIPPELGRLMGRNLFHSFLRFNLRAGESATFTGPASLLNIIARVTGGQSFIDGTLRSSVPGANLFLINPAGVVFGANAALDVGGSFHVSTADYLRFADGTRFFADPARESVLSVARPAAFGFLSSAPAPIAVNGAFLQVPGGRTLSLVGGDLDVRGGFLAAPGGRVQLVSVASAGEAGMGPAPDMSAFERLGRIRLTQGALVDASGDFLGDGAGGRVVIRGGRLLVAGGSQVASATFGDVDGTRVGVDIRLTETLTLREFGAVAALTLGGGRGGDVRVIADRVVIEGGLLSTQTLFGEGDAGNLSVRARRVDVLAGGQIGSVNQASGTGRGGDIVVRATEAIRIAGSSDIEASAITSVTLGEGAGGDIRLQAPRIILEGGRLDAQTLASGAGGVIDVRAGRLALRDGGAIISTTNEAGDGGDIILRVDGLTSIEGVGDRGPSQVSSIGQSSGSPGDVEIRTGSLRLADRARIRVGTIRGPLGGGLTIVARDSIVITGRAGIQGEAGEEDVGDISLSARRLVLDQGFIDTSTLEAGQAGDVDIQVRDLVLVNGGQIASRSALLAPGAGGNITIRATGSVTISGRSPDGVPVIEFSDDPRSGLFSTGTTGPAGRITVMAPSLALDDGGRISVAARGEGAAGDLFLDVGTLSMAGRSGLFSSTEGAGAGGNIAIEADAVRLAGRSTISATSAGTGVAGNIDIDAGRFESRNSAITTAATSADGGNITMRAGELASLVNSDITTSVGTGEGAGGNITIAADATALNRSEVRADAFGGPGGNVLITADVFLASASVLSASSALGVPGTIAIEASITDVSGGLATLPETPLEAAALLRASCAARLAEGRASSLVVAGREGVPAEPLGLLVTPLEDTGLGARADAPRRPLPGGTFPLISRVMLDPCGR